MRSRIANVCSTLILSGCALSTLGGCASAPAVAQKPEAVPIPVPVVKKVDASLLKPCEVRYRYRPDGMPVRDIWERLGAVEDALAICANQIELIRAAQDAPAPTPR